jgi:hypothetical protein
MGIFASIEVEEGVELPHFPDNLDVEGRWWQSKQGLDVYGGPYKLTAGGRLLRKEQSFRDKTEEEKQAEAEKWGCDSWDEYVQVYEDSDEMFPEELDWSEEENGYEDTPPTMSPRANTLDEEWWADHNMHGSFEFHDVIQHNPTEFEERISPDGGTKERPVEWEFDLYVEYEARFTKGDLEEIVLMDGRGTSSMTSDEMAQRLTELDKTLEDE